MFCCLICCELKGTVSQDFYVLVIFIKQLLLVPLEVPWNDFDFFQKFAEIFAEKSAQQCMIHRGKATPGCMIHRGMTTCRCNCKNHFAPFVLLVHIFFNASKFKKFVYFYFLVTPRCKIHLRMMTQQCMIHRGMMTWRCMIHCGMMTPQCILYCRVAQ